MAVFSNLRRSARECSKLALVARFAYKYRAIANNFRFETLKPCHMPALMDLAKGVCEDESVSLATGVTAENSRNMMEYMFEYTIAANPVANISQICYDNATNKAIGFRLGNPYYRDPSKAPFSVPKKPILSERELSLINPIEECYAKVWDIYPNEHAYLKGELFYVSRKYGRQGIWNVGVDYDYDFPLVAKKTGINLYACVCTSRVTKRWFEKLGFQHGHSSSPYVKNVAGEQVMLPGGELHLYTADLRTTQAINVKPMWDTMKMMKIL